MSRFFTVAQTFQKYYKCSIMKNDNKTGKSKKPHHENPLPGEITSKQMKENTNALHQAEKDMTKDAELTAHDKNDDLDEGETARLGEDKNDLV